jgi:hypothetical protein
MLWRNMFFTVGKNPLDWNVTMCAVQLELSLFMFRLIGCA